MPLKEQNYLATKERNLDAHVRGYPSKIVASLCCHFESRLAHDVYKLFTWYQKSESFMQKFLNPGLHRKQLKQSFTLQYFF